MSEIQPTSVPALDRDTRAHGHQAGQFDAPSTPPRRIDCAGPAATESRVPEPATRLVHPSEEELHNSHGRARR